MIFDSDAIFVGLLVDPIRAVQLSLIGGEQPSDLHVTLCVIPGNSTPIQAVVNCVQEAVMDQDFNVLYANTQGVARFNTTSVKPDAFVALVNSEDLCDLQCEICEELDEASIEYTDDFGGYIPHITLKYIDPNDSMPEQRIPNTDLTFTSIVVASGDNVYYVPMDMQAMEMNINL